MAAQRDNDLDFRQMQAGVEALSEGFALFDANDELVYCNASYRRLYPDLADFLVPGLPWSVFLLEVHRRHGTRDLEQLDAHLDSGIDAPLTLEACRRGNRWLRLSLHPVDGGGFVLTESDTTEQHQAHEAMENADELLRVVLDASASRIALSRVSDAGILYRTPAWEKTFDASRNLRTLFVDAVSYTDLLADLLSTRHVDDYDSRLLRREGDAFPARLSARIIDYQGEPAIVMSVEDMTQLYAAYQNEKMNALGQLLAGVAHELNNPLSVVVGHAMMLRDEVDDQDALDSIDKISRSAQRCAKIVKTFLAMARQKPVELERVDVNDIVRSALEIATYADSQQRVTIDLELMQDMSPVRVDEAQITQVLINLMVNAEQALAKAASSPTLRVSTLQDRANRTVQVRISDNGPGIAKELELRIFEPFFTTKAVDEGTGVGLALSHRIVHSHGGRLELASSEIGGATFVLTLPMADASEEPAIEASDHTSNSACRVLVVEDERDVAVMFSRLLHGMGISTSIASTAKEGLQMLGQDSSYDLVLCDLRMPGMGGRDMLQEVERQWPALSSRFVFVTGDGISADATAIRRSSTHRLLEKPVSPRELQSLVRSMTRREASPSASGATP